jgi:hypothetical protein
MHLPARLLSTQSLLALVDIPPYFVIDVSCLAPADTL